MHPEPPQESPHDAFWEEPDGEAAAVSRLRSLRESGDRSATPALITRLLDPRTHGDERVEVAVTLCALEDLRAVPALESALGDPARPAGVRRAILEVLLALPRGEPPGDSVEAWIVEPDPLLRAYGVSFLDAADGERIAHAVRDADLPVRRSAAEALIAIARTPPLVAAVCHALCDPDPLVREAACRAALFDEPLAAVPDLLRLLEDPEASVRRAACDALEDFPCVSVLLALADARAGGVDAATAEVSLALLLRRVLRTLDESGSGARDRAARWLAPAAWIIEEARARQAAGAAFDHSAAAASEGAQSGGSSLPAANAAEALAVLFDADAPAALQRELLLGRDWAAEGGVGVPVLERCIQHPDWTLRRAAAAALAAPSAAGHGEAGVALLRVASDREPAVRRTALEALLQAADPRALSPALESLEDPLSRPFAGDAALQIIARFGERSLFEWALRRELSVPDDRDGLLLGAVHLAGLYEVRAVRSQIVAVAESPVVASVNPHVFALRALTELEHPRAEIDLSHLESLDHLDVQAQLGTWRWPGGRFA